MSVPFAWHLSLHGVEKPITGEAKITRAGSSLTTTAVFGINIKDFGIAVPSYMGITVAEKVQVRGYVSRAGGGEPRCGRPLTDASRPGSSRPPSPPRPAPTPFPGRSAGATAICVTCHHNIGGGGVLTPYGRQLSRELLSTWGDEDEAEFAYGTVGLPSWLSLGGDVSYMATSQHAFELVQADVEAAAQHDRLLAVASVGRVGDTSDPMGLGWLSRRHYLQVGLTRSLSIRGGRFLPVYGVWNGDASVATRTGLGWDHDTYNVEANWVTDRWSAAAAAIVADADLRARAQASRSSGGVFR